MKYLDPRMLDPLIKYDPRKCVLACTERNGDSFNKEVPDWLHQGHMDQEWARPGDILNHDSRQKHTGRVPPGLGIAAYRDFGAHPMSAQPYVCTAHFFFVCYLFEQAGAVNRITTEYVQATHPPRNSSTLTFQPQSQVSNSLRNQANQASTSILPMVNSKGKNM